jgi:hypothetical protein
VFSSLYLRVFVVQAILLNTKGSPWSVRWFFVKPNAFYVSARASNESLNKKQIFYSGELKHGDQNEADGRHVVEKVSLLPKPQASMGTARTSYYIDTLAASCLMLTVGMLLGRNLSRR